MRVESVNYKVLTETLSSGTVGEDERPEFGAGVAWYCVEIYLFKSRVYGAF